MKKASYFLIIIVALILYYPVFSAGYVWDDNLLFVEKVKLLNEPLTWGLLVEPVLPDTTYFRPLIFLTMYLEFHLFGQNPLSSHIFNVIILIINSFLVSLIVYKILIIKKYKNEVLLSVLAGLMYVVNPVLVEATAWISGRFDLLVTTFILLGLYLLLTPKSNTWAGSILISICFLLALFSKELGIIFPVLIFFMYMFVRVNEREKYINIIRSFFYENKKNLICFLMVIGIYFFLRIQAMHGAIYHQSLDSTYINYVYFEQFLPIQSLFFYCKQFLLPFTNLTPLIPIEPLTNGLYSLKFEFLSLVLIFSFLVYGLIKKNKHIWLILSILLTIVLVIYIIPITIANNVAHNRFMTLGAAFFTILVVTLPYQKMSNVLRKLFIGLVSIWMLSAFVTTKSIVPFWQSDFTLWKWTYTLQSNNPQALNSYLYGLYQARQFDEIDRIVKKHQAESSSGLSVSDQMIYINTLISLNNPEALKYAKGLENVLPKFHLQYKNKSEYKYDLMSATHFASFYGAYALAESVFEGNAQRAIELNNIAYWYLSDDQKVAYFYNDVAYLYLSQNYDEARNLYAYLNKVSAYNKEIYDYNMQNIISMECMNQLKKSRQECSLENKKFLQTIQK